MTAAMWIGVHDMAPLVGMDKRWKGGMRKRLHRGEVLAFMDQLPHERSESNGTRKEGA